MKIILNNAIINIVTIVRVSCLEHVDRQKGDNVETNEIIQHTADLRKNLLNWSRFIKTEVDNINSELKRVEEKLEVIKSQDEFSYESVNLEAAKFQLLSNRMVIQNALESVYSDIRVLQQQVPSPEKERMDAILRNMKKWQCNLN